jgi:hypothetical protein
MGSIWIFSHQDEKCRCELIDSSKTISVRNFLRSPLPCLPSLLWCWASSCLQPLWNSLFGIVSITSNSRQGWKQIDYSHSSLDQLATKQSEIKVKVSNWDPLIYSSLTVERFFSFLLYYLHYWCWGLKSGPCTCQAYSTSQLYP